MPVPSVESAGLVWAARVQFGGIDYQVEPGFFQDLATLESRSGLPARRWRVWWEFRSAWARRKSKGQFTPEESRGCCGWDGFRAGRGIV